MMTEARYCDDSPTRAGHGTTNLDDFGPETTVGRRGGRRTTARIAAALGGGLLALTLLAPAAGAKQDGQPVKATPNPFATGDLPGCFGNLNATFNHDSGIQDHGRDSKGPGYYFRNGQDFKEAREFTRALFCG